MIGPIAATLLFAVAPTSAAALEESIPVRSETEFADDPDHPIPFIQAIDVMAQAHDGREVLVVMIASPLDADERLQRRLLAKFDSYLGYIQSDEFRREFGPPSREQTLIQVMIHPDSHPEIFELLERCRPLIEGAGASLEIDRSFLATD
ncbi:hypothetical protein [Brevundimonas sp.]|uniref:hypothetical protein n=1 Tax=Brevundimonas sp. TaxID=1871086 RepID=UPI002D1FBDB4|nr:hypothetical protein [Brevundimonas sp.]